MEGLPYLTKVKVPVVGADKNLMETCSEVLLFKKLTARVGFIK
jgi:hypothetical protein